MMYSLHHAIYFFSYRLFSILSIVRPNEKGEFLGPGDVELPIQFFYTEETSKNENLMNTMKKNCDKFIS